MLDAATYAPIPLKVAQLESDEEHLHSFGIFPCVYERRGLILRFAMWYRDDTAYYLHLTDRRIIVEPYEVGKIEKLLQKGILALAGAYSSGTGAAIALHARKGEINAANRKMEAAKGSYTAIRYSEIEKIDSFRSAFVDYIRLTLKDYGDQPMVFEVVGARKALACKAQFLAIVQSLMQ